MLTLVVLAAGMGSRFGGLKQLEGVGPSGETLLEYSVFDAARAGFQKVVFVIRKSFETQFREHIAGRLPPGMQVDFAFQELDSLPGDFRPPPDRARPWGTGHAVLCTRSLVEGPFAVINADDFYGAEGYALLAQFLTRSALIPSWPAHFALVAYRLDRTLSDHGSVSRGICRVDAAGYLQEVTERTRVEMTPQGPAYRDEQDQHVPLPGETPTSLNLFGFTSAIFDFLESQFRDFLSDRLNEPRAEFYLPQAVGRMIQRQQARVQVLRTPSEWMGITYPLDKPLVQVRLVRLHRDGKYPPQLAPA